MRKTPTDTHALEFLVTLSRMENDLRPGDRQNQREEVVAFLTGEDGNAKAKIAGPSLLEQLTDQTLNSLRRWVEHVLATAIAIPRDLNWRLAGRPGKTGPGFVELSSEPGGPSTGPRAVITAVTQSWGASLHFAYEVTAARPEGVLVVEGDLIDVVRWRVHDVLRRSAPTHLRACPVCERIFVKKRRAERCSRACTNKHWNDQALQKPGAREKRRAAAHRHYASKLPKNVKPRRNGRKG